MTVHHNECVRCLWLQRNKIWVMSWDNGHVHVCWHGNISGGMKKINDRKCGLQCCMCHNDVNQAGFVCPEEECRTKHYKMYTVFRLNTIDNYIILFLLTFPPSVKRERKSRRKRRMSRGKGRKRCSDVLPQWFTTSSVLNRLNRTMQVSLIWNTGMQNNNVSIMKLVINY